MILRHNQQIEKISSHALHGIGIRIETGVPFDQVKFMNVIEYPKKFRNESDLFIAEFPAIFPYGIENGYLLKEIRRLEKSGIPIRRIIVGGVSHTIRPAFLMPYHVALTDDIEKPLFLRKFDVPFRALAHVYGKDAMFWYRTEQSIGGNSIVGTTVRNPDLLPEHLAADERHSGLRGNRICVSATVVEQCILGASTSSDAGEKGTYPDFIRVHLRSFAVRWPLSLLFQNPEEKESACLSPVRVSTRTGL